MKSQNAYIPTTAPSLALLLVTLTFHELPHMAKVVLCAGFVVMLGVGPLVLAPLSETFGRRIIYLVCFTVFSLLQIPTALSPNVETLIALRTVAGFFGSMHLSSPCST